MPRALADALRNGNMGVMDYHNLLNLKADTGMRDSISRATAQREARDEAQMDQ